MRRLWIAALLLSSLAVVVYAWADSSNLALTPITSTAYEPYHIFKTYAGSVAQIAVESKYSTGPTWLQVFNATSIGGVTGLTPLICIPIPPANVSSDSFGGRMFSPAANYYFNVGIVAVLSTTNCATGFTSAGNTGWFDATIQ